MNVQLIYAMIFACAPAMASAQTALPGNADPSPAVSLDEPPTGQRAPAWATPVSRPASRPVVENVRRAASVTPAPSIYDVATADTRLRRGAIVRDAANLPSGTVVSVGTRLAVIMVGHHKVQVPVDAVIGNASTLAVAMTPATLQTILNASAKFQQETAKLGKR